MTKKLLLSLSIICAVFTSAYFISCSKPSVEPTPTPVVTCATKTIVITATVTAAGPAGASNGAITATTTGSTGFTYSLGTGAFQATGTFTNLVAGDYNITAKDDAGCTSVKSFTVTATPCPTINITAVITPTTNTTTANGAINATATGSTGFTYSIPGVAFQASGNFTGLSANTTYQVTAKDVNGCTTTIGFTVTSVACPTITVNTTTTPTASPTATNGSITATASGGLAPYTYSRDGITFQSTGVFNNLIANNYTVVAKDANGCSSASTVVVVNATPCPTITFNNTILGSDKCTNNTGRVTINAAGSTGFTYSFNGGAYQATNIFNNLGTGIFSVGAKDANGCIITATANVPVAAAGPTFTVVKNLLAANCIMCHGGPNPQNGINFTDDCTIVSKSARIKARAVDNLPSVMPFGGPPLSSTDKQKITDWINAGGQHSN
jgi:large repetitive protein